MKVQMQQSMTEDRQTSCYSHAPVFTGFIWADTAIPSGGSTPNYSFALASTSAFLFGKGNQIFG